MNTSEFVGSQMFMTIGIVVVVLAVLLLWFLRKRSNRHPMEHQRERNAAEMERGVPPQRE